MNDPKVVLEALQIAALGGVLVGFVTDVVFLSQINIAALAVIGVGGYLMFKNNELFWEMVEKYRR